MDNRMMEPPTPGLIFGRFGFDETRYRDERVLALPEHRLDLEELYPGWDFTRLGREMRRAWLSMVRERAYLRWKRGQMTAEQHRASEIERARAKPIWTRYVGQSGSTNRETPFYRFFAMPVSADIRRLSKMEAGETPTSSGGGTAALVRRVGLVQETWESARIGELSALLSFRRAMNEEEHLVEALNEWSQNLEVLSELGIDPATWLGEALLVVGSTLAEPVTVPIFGQ